ncbi:MAG: aminoacyl-tRNA hydrolase [Candidatus Omnitrophica bacterium]|nr:aminoacyl-tRNA hydrolase [Candidatus Omnitrophota bacterium]MDD5654765.1 aminoacyl-tRNA hydrolase [Candidatus Omnitrophota bacterium]
MKLIVGLGNPGIFYRNSRHNAGFRVVKALADEYGINLKRNKLTHSVEGKGEVDGERCIIAQPLTFMNLSGRSVKALLKNHNTDLSELLVVCDDMDLDTGAIRLRPSGSSGGHNGLQSIIDSVAGNEFARLRIGIGRPRSGQDPKDFVLSSFNRQERAEFTGIIEEAVQCCGVWLKEGLTRAMNRFNAKRKEK